jgi:hypothetical protein
MLYTNLWSQIIIVYELMICLKTMNMYWTWTSVFRLYVSLIDRICMKCSTKLVFKSECGFDKCTRYIS